VIDTLSLIVRRLLAGVSPFAGDRRHLHHLLLEAGLTPQQVTVLLVLVAFALGGIGFAGLALGVSDAALAAGLLLPLAAHIAFVRSRSGRRPQARPAQAAVTADRLDTADGSAE
jgi:UDP-GlcNAc:undecaprenyl-phosphate GlcNAc-1-phosphate transferase